MQKADGEATTAICASESAALLIMGMLPYMRNCYKDADDADGSRFAERCRLLELRHGLPLHSVQTPAYMAIDNARTHPQGRKMCSMMWQQHFEAAEKYRECEQWVGPVGMQLREALAQRAHPDWDALNALSTEWTKLTHKSTDDATTEVKALAKSVKELNALCDKDPTACGHPPQLVAPLSDKTPDINSPAENDVCCLKGHVERTVSEWVLTPEKDEALEKALTYWQLVLEKVEWMNTEDGMLTCLCCVKNGLVRVQLLAADAGEPVAVQKYDILKKVDHSAPNGQRRELRVTDGVGDGRAGRWVAQGVYKG